MKSIAVNFSKERLGLVRICAALYAWSTGELSLASRIGLIIPGFKEVSLKNSSSSDDLATFSSIFFNLSSLANPRLYAFSVNLMSALSCLKSSLYSALEVNILYGSSVPLVIKSSIKTPIYASSLLRTNSSFS